MTGLSRLQFWVCLALLLALFAFWNGPVWRHPWALDANALLSYAPIPLLVLGCLAWSRRLSLRWWALDTITLTAAKFAITYVAAAVMWSLSAAPTHGPRPQPEYAPPSAPEPPPPPSAIERSRVGVIEGVVKAADGGAVTGALVYIDSGLERYVFASPRRPVRLTASAAGVRPAIAAVQTYQPLELRSTDGVLHTLVAIDGDGERVFNRALPGDGTAAHVVLHEPAGVLTVRCRVHEAAGTEAPATLGVFAHPFFALTDADGRFRFDGVPASELTVAAAGARQGVTLAAGGRARVELVIAR